MNTASEPVSYPFTCAVSALRVSVLKGTLAVLDTVALDLYRPFETAFVYLHDWTSRELERRGLNKSYGYAVAGGLVTLVIAV